MIHRSLLLVATLLASFSQLAAYIIVPSLPAISASMPGLPSESLVAVYLVTVAIGQLLWGPASDRYGMRPTVLVGILIGLLGTLVCMGASTAPMLLLGRCVQAAGFSSCLVNSRSVLADRLEGTDLSKAFAMTTVWIAVIPSLTPIVGGLLSTAFGWRGPFAATALAALAVGLAMQTRLPTRNIATAPERYLTVLKSPGLIRNSLAGGAHFAAFTAITVSVPSIAARLLGWNGTAIGLLIAAMTPMFIVGAILTRAFPSMTDGNRVRLFMIAQALLAILAGITVGVGGLLFGVGMIAIAGYCVAQGLVLPALLARIFTAGRTGTGIASSIFGSVQLLGGGLAAAIVSAAAPPTIGVITGIVVVALLIAVGCVSTQKGSGQYHI